MEAAGAADGPLRAAIKAWSRCRRIHTCVPVTDTLRRRARTYCVAACGLMRKKYITAATATVPALWLPARQ
jgi:hypothetical protein